MNKHVTLHCYNCKSIILKLSEAEIKKLDGLNFQCECCGHQNRLENFSFLKGTGEDFSLDTSVFEKKDDLSLRF